MLTFFLKNRKKQFQVFFHKFIQLSLKGVEEEGFDQFK